MIQFYKLFLFISVSVIVNINNISGQGVYNIKYQVINTYPHHPESFTQGLFYYDNTFYEGVGTYGASALKQIDINSGKTLREKKLDKIFFGEGITHYKNLIYQLTWREHKCFVYNMNDFKLIKTLNVKTEGWGLTTAGDNLLLSDGTDKIYFLHPQTFNIIKTIAITLDNKPVLHLNELEYVKPYLYANQWMTNLIYKIDITNGKVIGVLDLTDVITSYPIPLHTNENAVLNGIAFNNKTNTFYITGKLWSVIFELRLKN